MRGAFSIDLKPNNPSKVPNEEPKKPDVLFSKAFISGNVEFKDTAPGQVQEKEQSQDEERLFKPETEVHVVLAETSEQLGASKLPAEAYKIEKFEELNLSEKLLRGIYAMGFTSPSKIQERALPLLLKDPPMNLIGQSQSGSGKTAAFALNILGRIDYEVQRPQAICLSPSRELAIQTNEVIDTLGKYLGVKTLLCVKDEDLSKENVLKNHVLVGTPGGLLQVLRNASQVFGGVKVLVLDEADNMLESQGLLDQAIRIKQSIKQKCQYVLFSATFADRVQKFAQIFAPNANSIFLKAQEVSVKEITQFYVTCRTEQKLEILGKFYDFLSVGQSIIFASQRVHAESITRLMKSKGNSVEYLHGGISSDNRDRIMNEFKAGKTKVLITTNVLSRGIDISTVTLVINFDMPIKERGIPDPETYIHRIGRTGRFGRKGISINLIDSELNLRVQQLAMLEYQFEIKEIKIGDWEETEEILNESLK